MTVDLKKALLDARRIEKQGAVAAATQQKQETLAPPQIPGIEEDLGTILRNEQSRAQREERERRSYASDGEALFGGDFGAQLRATLVQGTNQQIVQPVATALNTLAADTNLNLVDDRAREIYAKPAEERTPEEEAYLDQPGQRYSESQSRFVDTGNSMREHLDAATSNLETAEEIRFFLGNTDAATAINPINREDFLGDLGESYQANVGHFDRAEAALDEGDFGTAMSEGFTGIANLVVAGVGDIIENPRAAFEFVTENAPQLAIGGLSTRLLTATNAAYGLSIYEEAINDYRAEHGALPSGAEAAEMLAFSLSASAAEQIGDVAILKTFIPKGASTKTKAVMDKLAETKLGKTLAAATNNPVGRVAGATAGGTATEALTEIYQTAVEENFSRLNRDFDGEALFEAGVIGGASGGGLSGGGRGVSEVVGGGSTVADRVRNNPVDVARALGEGDNEAVNAAAESGDVSEFLNQQGENYRPDLAAEALVRRLGNEKLSETDREMTIRSMAQVRERISSQIQAAENELLLTDPETVSDLRAQREATEDEATQAQLDELIQAGESLSAEERSALQTNLARMVTGEDMARNVLRQGRIDARSQEDVDGLLTQVETAEEGPEQTQAANQVISLMMQDPGAVDAEQAAQLAESPAFTPAQQTYLRDFSDAQARVQAIKDSDQVAQDIFQGGQGFKGLSQYEADVAEAIQEGNQVSATSNLEDLRSFFRSHNNKANAIEEAQGLVAATGRVHSVIRDVSQPGFWRVVDRQVPEQQRRRNGAWVAGTSQRQQAATARHLVQVTTERDAIEAMGRQLRAAVELAFPAPAAEPEIDAAPEPEVQDAPTSEVSDAPAAGTEPEAVAPEPTLAEETPAEPEAQPEGSVAADPIEITDTDAEIAELLRAQEQAEEGPAEPGRIPDIDTADKASGNVSLEQLQSMNALLAYFDQREVSETDGSANPLVTELDYLSQVLETNDVDEAFLAGQEQLTPAQAQLLGLFMQRAASWDPIIEQNNRVKPTPTSAQFRFRNYMQYFEGNVPENVRTAISAAAFVWLSENGSQQYNDAQTINVILQRDEDHRVSQEEWALLSEAGTRESLMMQDLGRKAAQALALRARPDAPAGTQAQLELALGAQALAMMLQTGLMERNRLSDPMLDIGDAAGTQHPFVRVARGADGQLNSSVTEITTAARNTSGVLNRLFSIERGLVEPALEPGSFNQQQRKGTRQGVGPTHAAAQEAQANRPHRLKTGIYQAAESLSETTLLRIAGFRDMNGVHVQDNLRDSIQARNDSILRSLTRLGNFRERVQDGEFYFTPNVWVHHRTGLRQNEVNPQADKVQRHFITMDAWRSTISPQQDTEKMDMFRLGVAQGLGLKVDKQSHEVTLEQFRELEEDPAFQRAVAAVQLAVAGEQLTEQQEADIITAVEEGGEDLWSLDALVEYANYSSAGGQPFETDIMLEVDGVTNGPALAMTQLGIANGSWGPMFGFYNDSQPFDDFGQYKEAGNRDAYEGIAHRVNKILETTFAKPEIAPIRKFLDTNRNLFKQPLTSMIFGAAPRGAVEAMGNGLVEAFYERLQEEANQTGLAGVQNVVTDFNAMLPRALQIAPPASIEAAMAITLDPNQVAQAQQYFADRVGTAVDQVLQDGFAPFLEARNVLNKGAQALWSRYNAAYEHMVNERTREKIASGEIPANAAGTPYQGLPESDLADIRRTLAPLMPIIHTPFSRMDNDLSVGLDVTKISRRIVGPKDPVYGLSHSQEVRLGRPVPFTDEQGRRKTTERLNPRAMREVSVDPGVRAVIMLIHSLDSAVISGVYANQDIMNIHDAAGQGVEGTLDAAQALNQNTYELLRDYSVPMEIYRALQRSFDAEQDLVEQFPELADVLASAEVGRGENIEPVNQDLLAELRDTAVTSQANKLNFLETVDTVDQYHFEGGAYRVTDEARATVQGAQSALAQEFPQLVQQEQTEAEQTRPDHNELPEDTPWGVVGEPLVQSDPDIVAAFEANPRMPVMDVIRMAASSTTNEAQRELLRQIARTVDPATEVRYITPDTPGDVGGNFRTARGFYHFDGNGAIIGIKSPDFRHSGVTSELLTHELVHAAVAQTVERLQKEGNSPIIAELEALRSAAQEQLEGQFEQATGDIQELIAWGMTNPEFQLFLRFVTFESQANTRESGLRAFIRNLARLIFGDRVNEARQSGLGSLIANTGLLMEQAQREQGRAPIQLAMASPDPRSFNSQEILDALGRTSPAAPGFTGHLSQVLKTITDTVYEGGIYRDRELRSAPGTADDIYFDALSAGKAPFASDLIQNLSMSGQEAFVAESVEVTMQAAMDASPTAQRELRALYQQARQAIQSGDDLLVDPANATQAERDAAQRAWEMIFVPRGSDFLGRFAAASLAYKPLYDALNQVRTPVDQETLAGHTLAERIKILLRRAMAVFSRRITGRREGEQLGEAIRTTAQAMARIEAKRQARLARLQDRPESALEKMVNEVSQGTRDRVESFAQNTLRQSRQPLLRASGAILAATAGDRVGLLMEGIKRVRDNNSQRQLGLFSSILDEVRGERDVNTVARQILAEAGQHEQMRKREMTDMAKDIREHFGRELTRQESESLTRAVLKTDLTKLTDDFTLAEIERILSSDTELQSAIKQLESRIQGPHRKYYLAQAKALGYFMVTGEVTSQNLMLNAHNIAFLANTSRAGQVNARQGQAVMRDLDTLISLYAVRHSDAVDRRRASDIFREEANRESDNGIDLILHMHRGMQDDALESLFNGSPLHMIKGYIKEIHDPHVEILAAPDSVGAQLEQAGYSAVEGGALEKDPVDPSPEDRRLYVVRDRGLSRVIPGMMSLTGRRTKGWTIHSGITSLTDDEINTRNLRINNRMNAMKNQATSELFNVSESWQPKRPAQGDRSTLVPVLGPDGRAVNYRYMMKEETKRQLLSPDQRVDKILGHMVGHALDKQLTPALNQEGIDALRAQYDREFSENPRAFIEFGEDSPDPEIRERYRLLPEETKAYIKQVWGRNGLQIRNEVYRTAFGFRKFSLGDMFEKSYEEQNPVERIFTAILGQVEVPQPDGTTKPMGSRRALRLVRAENMWQEIVNVVKDTWVIKNLVTLIGNELSNATVLALRGVPLREIARGKAEGIQATVAYQTARRERDSLQRQVDFGYITGQARMEAEQRIVELDDELERNPVKVLVDAGMFQTLVEDIGIEEDPYSYKSKLDRWVGKKTGWVPGPVKTAGRFMFMTHDTALYQFLNRATVFSDFTSRYVLHKHLSERQANRLDSGEIITQVREAFVNYDVPTHRTIQYLNDMGIVPFTKYYLRIQVVIFQMLREAPGRALALLGLQNLFGDISDILDSSVLNRMPFNLRWGAFELPGALDEPITIRAVSSVL